MPIRRVQTVLSPVMYFLPMKNISLVNPGLRCSIDNKWRTGWNSKCCNNSMHYFYPIYLPRPFERTPLYHCVTTLQRTFQESNKRIIKVSASSVVLAMMASFRFLLFPQLPHFSSTIVRILTNIFVPFVDVDDHHTC